MEKQIKDNTKIINDIGVQSVDMGQSILKVEDSIKLVEVDIEKQKKISIKISNKVEKMQ